jgi:hypothetical protein
MRILFSGLAALGMFLCAEVRADIIGVAGGSGDPGPTLGGYTMTPFGADPQALFIQETSLPSPLGGVVGFSPSVEHLNVADWGDPWKNSYTGDVYFNNNFPPVTLTLPSGTGAFYLFAQPNAYAFPIAISMTAQNGTTVTQVVQTNLDGSEYFGFYATNGDQITSLTISAPVDNNEVAFGEFAIAESQPSAVPEPATISLLLTGGLFVALGRCRRRGRRGGTADGQQ